MTNPFKNDDIIIDSAGTSVNPDAEVEVNQEEVHQEAEENIQQGETDNDLQAKFDNLNNQYIRLAADFDNYRKRQAQERESLLKYGAENTLKKIVEVLDNFERGEKANENVEDCDKLKESFNLVHKQLIDVLTKVGLETIDAEGQEFDPNFHEAVMQTPTSEYPEHTVISVLQKGYKLEDRVLRPALVNVATSEG
ncbi:MAG: nucleotide exchange factor GrpE [Cyanobacteria bacterium RUI128]|nr:nucleotide exchange factor GrpE [Cyanobacteria bacterium RUI128]